MLLNVLKKDFVFAALVDRLTDLFCEIIYSLTFFLSIKYLLSN